MFTRKDLIKLIIPLIIEQVLGATIGIADTLMVATVGEVAVSGVSLVDTINMLLFQVFAALSTGGAIISAQYLGREDDENARVAAKQLILVAVSLSLVIMAGCLLWRAPMLGAMFGAAEPAVMRNANTYFWLSALSYPFIALYNACAALFRAQGNSRISMLAALVMNVTNVTGNAILIFGFDMGVAGAATASLVARALGAFWLLYLLHNRNNRVYLESILPLTFKPAMVKSILRLGVPTGLENSMFHIGKILVQGLIASFGTVAIAANAVANSIMSMAQVPGSAIGLSMVTVVGQSIGARDYKQARGYILKLTGAAYLLMGSLNILLLFVIGPIISLFHLTPETEQLTRQICFICSIMCITLWPAAFTLPNGLRAANDVKYSMTVAVFSMWVFRVGLSYVIGRWMGFGVVGVWIAMGFDWLFRLIMFVARFISGKWMNKQVI